MKRKAKNDWWSEPLKQWEFNVGEVEKDEWQSGGKSTK